MKQVKFHHIILFPTVVILLSGCVKPHIAKVDTENAMAQRAHQTCLEYGAKPGTRLFYRCMNSQMRKEQYNHAMTSCSGPESQSNIESQCSQSVAIGSFDYWQKLAACKSDLTTRCEQQASNEYLHRNNAQKYDFNVHDYNHNYGQQSR